MGVSGLVNICTVVAGVVLLGVGQSSRGRTSSGGGYHDAHPRAQRLALLHAVGGEDDRSFLTLGDDVGNDFPHESARDRIHACMVSYPNNMNKHMLVIRINAWLVMCITTDEDYRWLICQ